MVFSGNVPFPFGGGRDVQVNASPLTHHDNLSVLRMLEWLRRRTEELQDDYESEVAALDKALREYIAKLNAENDEDRARIERELLTKIAALQTAVSNLSGRELDSVLSYDPTSGTRSETISVALDRAYAENRIFAYRASEEDGLGLTAQEADERGWDAREHDLYATQGILNVLPGQLQNNRRVVMANELREVMTTIEALTNRVSELEKKGNR